MPSDLNGKDPFHRVPDARFFRLFVMATQTKYAADAPLASSNDHQVRVVLRAVSRPLRVVDVVA